MAKAFFFEMCWIIALCVQKVARYEGCALRSSKVLFWMYIGCVVPQKYLKVSLNRKYDLLGAG